MQKFSSKSCTTYHIVTHLLTVKCDVKLVDHSTLVKAIRFHQSSLARNLTNVNGMIVIFNWFITESISDRYDLHDID
jgi:hypothetical protein